MFHEGDIASKFYLIIRGSVDVLTKKEEVLNFTYKEFLEYIKENSKFILKINGQSYTTPADINLMSNTNSFKNWKSLNEEFYDKLMEELKGSDSKIKLRYTGLKFKLRDQTK